VSLIDTAEDENRNIEADAAMTVYVCITCRRPSDPEDSVRPGLTLAQETTRAADGSGVKVRQIRCLANCSRACSAAIRRDGAWTYVFGGLEPERDAAALIDGAKLFARAADGLMPWRSRPDILKRGLIARVPPIDFEEEAE
jgi:predicted metal-binding protein